MAPKPEPVVKKPAANLPDIVSASVVAIESLRDLELPVMRAVDLIARCIAGGCKVLTCGNGGSAADASHLATEFIVRYVDDRRPYPAICLNDSGCTLTAAANDYGYDGVFARQVAALGRGGDVLIAFSTSGRSPSVLKALEQTKNMRMESIAMLGRDGGAAKGLATVELIVPSSSTARIQEAHAVLIHALCELVEQRLSGA